MKPSKLVWFLFLSVFSALLFAEAPGYHIIKTVKLGGEGGWDYLTADSAARRLYISRGSHVMVVGMDNYEVIADLQDMQGVHGVALAKELNRGFTSNGKTNDVSIFDLKTFMMLGRVKAGENPDAILYDTVSKKVFAFNGKSNDVTAFDAATGEVRGTIKVGGKPEFPVADGAGKIYVNIEDTNEVAELDSNKLELTRRFLLKPGEEPTGMALDRRHGRVFSACHNKLLVALEADSGKFLGTIDIGAGVDGAAFDPETGFIFASNGEGTLTVAKELVQGEFAALETVPTKKGARTMAIDEKTHNVFLVSADLEPAPAAKEGEKPQRPKPIPGSFVLIVMGPQRTED